MLKITTIRESDKAVLKLEGKLGGDWTKELERVWSENAQHGSVAVDLSDVNFVSPEGRQLLESMYRQRVELRSRSLVTQYIISQIKNTFQRKSLYQRWRRAKWDHPTVRN